MQTLAQKALLHPERYEIAPGMNLRDVMLDAAKQGQAIVFRGGPDISDRMAIRINPVGLPDAAEQWMQQSGIVMMDQPSATHKESGTWRARMPLQVLEGME